VGADPAGGGIAEHRGRVPGFVAAAICPVLRAC
jgi:hypothetical protein